MCAHYQPKGTESSATISGYSGGQAWAQLRALRRQQAAVAVLLSEGVGFGSPAFSLVLDQVGEDSVQARRGRWEWAGTYWRPRVGSGSAMLQM